MGAKGFARKTNPPGMLTEGDFAVPGGQTVERERETLRELEAGADGGEKGCRWSYDGCAAA